MTRHRRTDPACALYGKWLPRWYVGLKRHRGRACRRCYPHPPTV